MNRRDIREREAAFKTRMNILLWTFILLAVITTAVTPLAMILGW